MWIKLPFWNYRFNNVNIIYHILYEFVFFFYLAFTRPLTFLRAKSDFHPRKPPLSSEQTRTFLNPSAQTYFYWVHSVRKSYQSVAAVAVLQFSKGFTTPLILYLYLYMLIYINIELFLAHVQSTLELQHCNSCNRFLSKKGVFFDLRIMLWRMLYCSCCCGWRCRGLRNRAYKRVR